MLNGKKNARTEEWRNAELTQNVRIIGYDPRYKEDAEELMVELETYLAAIDGDHLDMLGEGYREKMLAFVLRRMRENDGAAYLAVAGETAVGLIIGEMVRYAPEDHLDYSCPKQGIVTELVVKQEYRGRGIGQTLLRRMEEFFAAKGCEYAHVDVFAYNRAGLRFYEREGYHPRMIGTIKKLTPNGKTTGSKEERTE